MIWLIYSDVHGNLPAFEAILNDCGSYDASICLGDLVNYGPWSNECVELALSLKNPLLIKGNHEDAFLNRHYPGSNALVQQFFKQTITGFNKMQEIALFVDKYVMDNYHFQHTVNNSYVYPDTDMLLNANYVIGHSHHQFVYENNGFRLYNAGSVGQNRKLINMADYLLYDQGKKQFTRKSVIYDLDLMVKEMTAKKYPDECIAYYLNKQRA